MVNWEEPGLRGTRERREHTASVSICLLSSAPLGLASASVRSPLGKVPRLLPLVPTGPTSRAGHGDVIDGGDGRTGDGKRGGLCQGCLSDPLTAELAEGALVWR